MAAFPVPSEGKSGAGSFASELDGVTAEAADADAWRSAAPAAPLPPLHENAADQQPALNGEAVFSLPETAVGLSSSALGFNLPTPHTKAGVTPKPAVPSHSSTEKAPRRKAASAESAQTVAVAVPPAPVLEIVASTSTAADDSTNEEDTERGVKPAVSPSTADAAEAAPAAVTATGAPAQPAQEMAFAAKVQPVQGAEHAALPAEMTSAANVASANRKVVAAAEDENASPADAPGLLAATATATAAQHGTGTASTAATPATAAPPTARPAEAPAPPAENLPKASAPLKDIAMQVNQPGKERVDVRVVQQGGEVHISVHSADAGMTSGLRQGLSELQSKLEESGYRSEMWRPGNSATPVASAPSAQASTNHSRGGDGQPQQGGSQQDGSRRNPNQSNQPRWVEELESSLGSGEQSSGGFYGFGS